MVQQQLFVDPKPREGEQNRKFLKGSLFDNVTEYFIAIRC